MKQRLPDVEVIAATDRDNKFEHLLTSSPDITTVTKIWAGKLRRYHNQSALQQLLDVHTLVLNIRDIFRVVIGTFQAVSLLRRTRPDVIFIKGGFVGVPLGIAGRLCKIPFITHDSDTVPGLANRIIARWATIHAVGMPERFYAYPKAKTVQVGNLTPKDFVRVSDSLRKAYRKELSVPVDAQLVVIIGGSLGSQNLNTIVGHVLAKLLPGSAKLYAIHQTGGKAEGLPSESDHYRQMEFITDLYKYTGAADVVITRAGANSMAELAVQGKAAIVVPAPQLAGGHQVTNGHHLAENKAAIVLSEEALMTDQTALEDALTRLLADKKQCVELATNLTKMYKPNASKAIADIIIQTGQRTG